MFSVRACAMTVALSMTAVMVVAAARASLELVESLAEIKEELSRDYPKGGARGLLAGWKMWDLGEWNPTLGDQDVGILFGVTDFDGAERIEYWSHLASRLQEVLPSVHLVGLCLHQRDCVDQGNVTANLVILNAMDPAFVHNVHAATEGGSAVLLRGGQVVGALKIPDNSENLFQQIVMRFRGARQGGGV